MVEAPQIYAEKMLEWYDANARRLPWRVRGALADPYKVWLSEIMLQQTTVQAVKPYFAAFTERWPDVKALAEAKDEDVLAAWAGLGYYSRARNLIKTARRVATHYQGQFPSHEADLLTLPGIGPYTAAAIASIAFGKSAVVVDGNVERVMARLFAIETPMPAAKIEIKNFAAHLTPQDRAGDYAQSLMDLGATICSPKRPACGLCPLRVECISLRNSQPENFPVKAPKLQKPTRHGRAFLAVQPDGSLLLHRRQDKGLLGGMVGVPHGEWLEDKDQTHKNFSAAPYDATWRKLGEIKHTFTHFHLLMEIYYAPVRYSDKCKPGFASPEFFFESWNKLEKVGLPTVFKKAINIAAEKLQKPPLANAGSLKKHNYK